MRALVLILAGTPLLAAGARADIVVPGADGSDGPFSPTSNVVVDLSLAPTGAWDGPNTSPGNGVYDPEKWAVVFRYSSVNVPSGVTVTFLNHPSGAPVVWLVSEGVTIAGSVLLNGQDAVSSGAPTIPGPGGFAGGKRETNTGFGRGAGPGGGNHTGNGQAGSYAYGSVSIRPLIGGSGGSSDNHGLVQSGGAGGGAILIACETSLTVTNTGRIQARGGHGHWWDNGGHSGSGSGGAVRIAADTATIGGILNTEGGTVGNWGGAGRIRIEANTIQGNGPINPSASTAVAGTTALVWPEDLSPVIRVTSIGTAPVPADPSPRLPTSDVDLDVTNPITITIAAENVPTDWNMTVRVTPVDGTQQTATAVFMSGDLSSSTWQAQITVPIGKSAVQVRASAP